MKKFGIGFVIVMALAAIFTTNEAQACGAMGCAYYYNQGFSGALPPPVNGGGVQVGVGVGPGGVNVGVGVNPGHGVVGGHGMVRPAYYGAGRYPLVRFPAPIRRSMGLPGFTPVRQFLFGRGAIRRQSRRAFFGRACCC